MSGNMLDVAFSSERLRADCERLFGAAMSNDTTFCERLYGSLTNLVWIHESGEKVLLSFRVAGGMISDLLNQGGDYMDWYCCAPEGTPDQEIVASLAGAGWRFERPEI